MGSLDEDVVKKKSGEVMREDEMEMLYVKEIEKRIEMMK